jgi:hypothetical protein
MVKESIHMNSQAGRRLRQAAAIRGNTEIGSQPIHEEPRKTVAGSLPLVSLKLERSLSSRNANLVDSGKLVAICPHEAANQFGAGKMTEAQESDAFVGGATFP